MIVKLLTEHHLEFLSLKGGCRGSPESTHVKMSNCWKSHALAHIKFRSPYDNVEIRTHRQLRYHVILYAFMQPKNVTAMKNRNCTHEKCN